MADKYKLERTSGGGFGIDWTDKTKTNFHLRAVKATTDVKQLKAKNRQLSHNSKFGEPKSLGEISCDVRNKKEEATRGKVCLGIILCENGQKIDFASPATIS